MSFVSADRVNAEFYMKRCSLCVRDCGVNRMTGAGRCGETYEVRVARAALHMWEEPCISGTRGSGAIFFEGCPLGCVFCQNREISRGRRHAGTGDGRADSSAGNRVETGTQKRFDTVGENRPGSSTATSRVVSGEQFARICLRLEAEGAHNINLVTPTHYIPQIIGGIARARSEGLQIPVVYNTASIEKPESVRMLRGTVDIFLPDLKYSDSGLAGAWSHMPEYFEAASRAIEEMVRISGPPVFEEAPAAGCSASAVPVGKAASDPAASPAGKETPDPAEPGMLLMKRGTIVRHMVMPGHTADSKRVLEYLHSTYGNDIYISILRQYTPMPGIEKRYPELGRRVTKREYDKVVDYALSIGIENAFLQEGGTAEESFIPAFNGEGV